MSNEDGDGSGNTGQRPSRAVELAAVIGAAATLTTMATGSTAKLALFISLVVATALGMHLSDEDL